MKYIKQLIFIFIMGLFAIIMSDRAAAHADENCMIEAVYHEARGESFIGQIAVANVIRNRAKRKHKGVCSIIKERKQFSYRDGFFVTTMSDKKAVTMAKNATIASMGKDLTNGAVFYNTKRLGVRFKGHHPVIIGSHVFYRGEV